MSCPVLAVADSKYGNASTKSVLPRSWNSFRLQAIHVRRVGAAGLARCDPSLEPLRARFVTLQDRQRVSDARANRRETAAPLDPKPTGAGPPKNRGRMPHRSASPPH